MAYADTYKTGSTGKAVEGIQQQLKKLGLYQGDVTGYFGPQTETAVKRFQLKRGMHADGIVGASTYKYLMGNVKSTVSTSTQVKTTVTQGMSLKEVQAALKKLGYYTGAVDGIAGSNTENAIKKFQKANNLTADGIVGAGTSKLLSASTSSDSDKKHTISIKEIQSVLKKLGYYTGAVDGVSGSKTELAIQKFQKANKLIADGVVGQTTKNKMVAAAAKADASKTKKTTTAIAAPAEKPAASVAKASTEGDTELLDWWTEVSKIFKRGSMATVTDLKTGKTFEIVRTYGTNHADVEARTAEDSKTIKAIWGGWSWDRRPVIVEVDGRKLAGSMTAMPHAGVDKQPANTYVSNRSGGFNRGTNFDMIKDNGMSGHMDIHFLNSRNHYNNKVDPKHQAVVKQAAKY